MTAFVRKQLTEQLLLAEGIPVNPFLPSGDDESSMELRSARDVGLRLLCLFCVVGTAFDTSNDAWARYLKHYRFWDHLSPFEREFMTQPDSSVASQLTWRSEAMYVLLWALGLFEEASLSLPRDEADTEAIVERLPALNDPPEPFLASLNLRSASEILDAVDLVYRCHWAVRNASLSDQPIPGRLQLGIIQEWHHALNWLTCYQRQDWDEVSTDT